MGQQWKRPPAAVRSEPGFILGYHSIKIRIEGFVKWGSQYPVLHAAARAGRERTHQPASLALRKKLAIYKETVDVLMQIRHLREAGRVAP